MAGRNYTAITLNEAFNVTTFTQSNVFNVNAGLLQARSVCVPHGWRCAE